MLPEENALVLIEYRKKNYWVARLKTITKKSKYRIDPICPVYDKCGGCSIQHINTAAHSSLKIRLVTDNLERIGKMISIPKIDHFLPNQFFEYRNKTSIPVSIENNKLLTI